MGEFIIVWRNSHRDPHIYMGSHNFKESFSSYDDAKEYAEETVEAEGKKSEWYFDYQIYESVDS